MSKATKKRFVTKRFTSEFVLPKDEELVGQVVASRGRDLHEVVDVNDEQYLASMPPRFRKSVYVRRGQFVYLLPIAEGDKVKAEITHVLDTETVLHLQKERLWPTRFEKEANMITRFSTRNATDAANPIDSDMMPSTSSDNDTDSNAEDEDAYEEDSEDEQQQIETTAKSANPAINGH